MQCLPDDVVGEELIGDYLLYKLNSIGNQKYTKHYSIPPTNEFGELIRCIGTSIGALNANGSINRNRAAIKFIQDFRKGHLGLCLLDSIAEQKGVANRPTLAEQDK